MGRHKLRLFIALATFIALLAGDLQPAAANGVPSLRLTGTPEHQSIVRKRKSEPIFAEFGAWIRSVGGAFELRASRDGTYGPITLRQVDADTLATIGPALDADLMDGWSGLKDFLEIEVSGLTKDGLPFDTTTAMTWCPNGYERERTGDAGSSTPLYPESCGYNPFTRGAVWGVEADWATNPMGYGGDYVFVPDGSYTATLKIADSYQALFNIAPVDAETSVTFDVKTKRRRRRHSSPPPSRAQAAAFTSPPMDDTPDPAWLPDLQALPAWSIGMDGNEMSFAATEWNSGPQPMVIEGFRDDTSDDTMDALQYFYDNGEPVAKDAVGELEYHEGGGHDHWHFQQFVSYELIDDTDAVVATSGKQAWCLVPTDAIDMTVEGAEWRPWNTDLNTACGGPKSLWVRETLPVGHGDTYFQVSGQAFDVTGLPDGDYRIRITVNPTGAFHESNATNNVSFREVELGGFGGARTVTVAPVYGIDA